MDFCKFTFTVFFSLWLHYSCMEESEKERIPMTLIPYHCKYIEKDGKLTPLAPRIPKEFEISENLVLSAIEVMFGWKPGHISFVSIGTHLNDFKFTKKEADVLEELLIEQCPILGSCNFKAIDYPECSLFELVKMYHTHTP